MTGRPARRRPRSGGGGSTAASGAGGTAGTAPIRPAPQPVLQIVALFAASRLAVLACAWVVTLIVADRDVLDVLLRWDGGWYVLAAGQGYPRTVPPGTGLDAATTLPFFPGFPLAIRAVAVVTTLPMAWAAVVASHLFGLTATLAVWWCARAVTDERTALRSAALVAFFPSAAAFSQPYSEGLFLTAAALCLWGLVRQRWVVAGLCAAVATGTRPNGIAVIAACAWAAGAAIAAERQWKAATAVALAPLGLVAWALFLWQHTGDPLIWFEAQQAGFQSELDFGVDAFARMRRVVMSPLADFNLLVAATSVAFLAVSAVLLARWRPPAPFAVYAGVLVLPLLLRTGMGSLWRYLLTAFPLLIAVARDRSEATFSSILGVSAVALGVLTIVLGGFLFYTP